VSSDAGLAGARRAVQTGPATLGELLALYLTHRTPKKTSPSTRAEDRRRAELWSRHLGAGKRVHQLGRTEWDTFITLRTSGARG
jgi:hypothetical protein